mmetsp:Transcript_37357/g.82182  ORF Transcript_37357/g.82182 Transcript_37357/m.82182 type:complete len:416 (+) Transcript_37357:716-1963(+)
MRSRSHVGLREALTLVQGDSNERVCSEGAWVLWGPPPFEWACRSMDAVVGRVGWRLQAELLPLRVQHAAQRPLGRLRRVGWAEDGAAEVGPLELVRVKLHNVVVDRRRRRGELAAHAHEERVERVDGRLALHLEQRHVEAAAELDNPATVSGLFPAREELLGVDAEVRTGVDGVVGAVLLKHGAPVLAKLLLELVVGHVELRWLEQRRLARDRVVVLVDVLLGVDGGAVDVALAEHGDACLAEALGDQLLHLCGVGVRLGEDKSALLDRSRRRCFGVVRLENALRVGPHLLHGSGAVEGVDEALVAIVLDDGLGLAIERNEALLDGFDVVVGPAARLAALEQTLLKNGLAHLVHEDAGDVELAPDSLLPAGEVVGVPWETVHQEALAAVDFDGVQQQLHRDFHWNDFALFDVGFN